MTGKQFHFKTKANRPEKEFVRQFSTTQFIFVSPFFYIYVYQIFGEIKRKADQSVSGTCWLTVIM